MRTIIKLYNGNRYSPARYTYATAKTFERIEAIAEDCFANGDILEGELPQLEKRVDHRGRLTHWELTLAG